MQSTFKSSFILLLSWCVLVLHSMNYVVLTYGLYYIESDKTHNSDVDKLLLIHYWEESMQSSTNGSESGEDSEQLIENFTEIISDFIVSHSHKIEITCVFMAKEYDTHLPLFLPKPCIELHLCPPELV